MRGTGCGAAGKTAPRATDSDDALNPRSRAGQDSSEDGHENGKGDTGSPEGDSRYERGENL